MRPTWATSACDSPTVASIGSLLGADDHGHGGVGRHALLRELEQPHHAVLGNRASLLLGDQAPVADAGG